MSSPVGVELLPFTVKESVLVKERKLDRLHGSFLRLGSKYPERVTLVSDDLLEHVRSFDDASVLLRKDALSQERFFYANDFFRFEEAFTSFSWPDAGKDDTVPEFVRTGIIESRWAFENSQNSERVAWFLVDRLFLLSPFTLTLADALEPPNLTSPYRYSEANGGWVLRRVEEDADALSKILTQYGVSLSAGAGRHLDGRGEALAVLERTAKDALEDGFVVPTGFDSGRALKPHQEVAALTLGYNNGGILADQVGLGKGGEFTTGFVALDQWIAKDPSASSARGPLIVSVPKSMKVEIAEEVSKWTNGKVITIVEGAKSSPLPPSDVYVMNHDILAPRLEDIKDTKPVGFIADECHVFKNADAKRSQAALDLAKDIRKRTDEPYIVMASGTPFLNTPAELWMLLLITGKADRFADYARKKLNNPKQKIKTKKGRNVQVDLSDRRCFEMRWCGGHFNKYRQWEIKGSSNEAELNRLLVEHGMVRRKKSDVISPLPKVVETVVKSTVNPQEREHYNYVKHNFEDFTIERLWDKEVLKPEADRRSRHDVERAAKKILATNAQIMSLTALREVTARIKARHTVDWIVDFMEGRALVKNEAGQVIRVGDDPRRRKLIVYVHHRGPREFIMNHPDIAKYGVVTILPGTEQKDESIQEAKRVFQQNDDEARIIVCSMAAREGHTLTAAYDVYLHEIPFVPSWIVQMAGRCWARFSELYPPHAAFVHYAVARNTVDASLVRKNRLKKGMFNAVIDGENSTDLLPTEDHGPTSQEVEDLLDDLIDDRKEMGVAS